MPTLRGQSYAGKAVLRAVEYGLFSLTPSPKYLYVSILSALLAHIYMPLFTKAYSSRMSSLAGVLSCFCCINHTYKVFSFQSIQLSFHGKKI